MLESQESLIVRPSKGAPFQVWVVEFESSVADEMTSLLETLEARIEGKTSVQLRKIHPSTFVGKGKLDEIKLEIEGRDIHAIVFDQDLSPKQLVNLEKYIGLQVVDRSGVILDIFSQHARTREAKTQVELARVQYMLPRLAHFWTHFERQRGGGGGGAYNRGMGEKQIEVDRRILQRRVKNLRKRLEQIKKERALRRKSRGSVNKVALVGYTNVGKSTLLNALTKSDVLAENKLFATLDARFRALDPDSKPPVVAIDTVGFISRIPTSLIASFKSTLEELMDADLLVHVVDASAADAQLQMEVTEEVLNELGLSDKERIYVLNKMDQVQSEKRNLTRLVKPGAFRISAKNPDDVENLRRSILDSFKKQLEQWEVLIPYDKSKIESQLRSLGSVETLRYLDKGVYYRIRIRDAHAKQIGLEKFRL